MAQSFGPQPPAASRSPHALRSKLLMPQVTCSIFSFGCGSTRHACLSVAGPQPPAAGRSPHASRSKLLMPKVTCSIFSFGCGSSRHAFFQSLGRSRRQSAGRHVHCTPSS